MSWRNALLAIAFTTLCAVCCKADPVDAQLDAIQSTLSRGDATAALEGLAQISNSTPSQTLRTRYYHAYVRYLQKNRAAAETELVALVPPADAPAIQRSAFGAEGGIYSEKARALLGAVYNETARFDLLIPYYRMMETDYPANPEWPYLLANSFFAAGRYNEAAAQYRKCIGDYPNYSRAMEAWFRVVECLRSAQRYQEAYDTISDIPQTDIASEIRAAALKAELLAAYLHKDYERSIEICEAMIAKYPGEPSILHCRYRLASTYLTDLPPAQRDYAKAREMLAQLIVDYPKDNMVFEWKINVAHSYALGGNHSEAVAGYSRLLTAYPDAYPTDNWHSYIRYLRAESLVASHRTAEGVRAWQEIVTKYPGDGWAKLASERLATR